MMSPFAKNDHALKALGIALAITNLTLWFGVVWLRAGFDARAGRLNSPLRPDVVIGVQELLVYFDYELSYYVFPLVYTLGFAVIPFLFQTAKTFEGAKLGTTVLAILMLCLEMVWISLIAIIIFCRGPNWNLYWPWETWDLRVIALNYANFSGIFWWHLAGQWIPVRPWVREAPGLCFTVGYFAWGLLVARCLSRRSGYVVASFLFLSLTLFVLTPLSIRWLLSPHPDQFDQTLMILLAIFAMTFGASYTLFRLLKVWSRANGPSRPMNYWQSVPLVMLILLAALVPIKVFLYWVFNMKYLVSLHEFSFNL